MKSIFKASVLIAMLFIAGCSKIPKLNRVLVNILPLSDMGLSLEQVNAHSDLGINYYYGDQVLYIADSFNKRILGVDANNRIFFQLGNVKNLKTAQKNFWKKDIFALEKNLQKTNHSKKETISLESKSSHGKSAGSLLVEQKYHFDKLDKIAVDFKNNLYVVNEKETKAVSQAPLMADNADSFDMPTQNLSTKTETQIEILKFSPEGKFLYRLGEEGRDNLNFRGDVKILSFSFNKENGVWIKYLKDGKIYIRFYTDYGKNILDFEEPKINNLVENYLKGHNDENTPNYLVEDIFPLTNSQTIMVVINLYRKEKGMVKIESKKALILDKHYVVTNTWPLKGVDSQIYSVTNKNLLYNFSYNESSKDNMVEIYDMKGDLSLKRTIDFNYSYYKRLGLSLTQQGSLMGLFLRNTDLIFVIWR